MPAPNAQRSEVWRLVATPEQIAEEDARATKQMAIIREVAAVMKADCMKPNDDGDFVLGKACDLTGEGACEACQ